MKWFRMYTDILDDMKLRALEEADKWRFICLLAVASEHDKDGLIPESIHDISWRIRCRQDHLEKTIEKLVQLNILKSNGNGIEFVNWKKRQFISDNTTERWRKWKSNVGANVGQTLEPTPPETETDTDTEYIPSFSNEKEGGQHSPLEPDKEKKLIDRCPHQKIIALYHNMLPELPKVKNWPLYRQKLLYARWSEKPGRQLLSWWKIYFTKVRKSDFLMGKTERPFKTSLEWLLRPVNFNKVLEDMYE